MSVVGAKVSSRAIISLASCLGIMLSAAPLPAPAQVYTATPSAQTLTAYMPAGMVLPVKLSTGLSSATARVGDLVFATLERDIHLGNAVIPAGSTVSGQVTEAKPGQRLGRSGTLAIKFTGVRTAAGTEFPIVARLTGGLEKYAAAGGTDGGAVKGEKLTTKGAKAALQGAVGVGTGAALGTAVGAIAGRSGRSLGRGAWSGAAIGGGLGVASGLFLRRGTDVALASGTSLQLQLDAPSTIVAGAYRTAAI